MASDQLEIVFRKIDELAQHFIDDRLKPAVAIQSVSSDHDPKKRQNVYDMTAFLEKELKDLKADVKRYPLGNQPETDPVIKLPDVIVANYPSTYDNKKKTILIYGHYDVQPAGEDWTGDPWLLDERDGKLYGRGSTDDKGPVLAWLNALEAYQKADVDVPVNLIFCFEGMEESGSVGFADFAKKNSNIFNHVDAACISDNYWLTTEKPCLTYGLRGINYFTINVSQKALPGHKAVPLHSGMFGGTVHEPMTELVILLSKLVNSKGNILIPGIDELVDDVSSEEMTEYDTIDFTMRDFESVIGTEAAIYNDPKKTLLHRWRYPSLTIHGISGADSTTNQTTAIYPSVTGKFSIRTVPSMEGQAVKNLVVHYVEKEFNRLRSKNKCVVEQFGESASYWLGSRNDANFQAGKDATNRVYKTFPDLTREGGSIGVTLDLQNILGSKKSIMLLPVGMSDDGAHGPNEKLNRVNYIKGSKLLGAYWYYFANSKVETSG